MGTQKMCPNNEKRHFQKVQNLPNKIFLTLFDGLYLTSIQYKLQQKVLKHVYLSIQTIKCVKPTKFSFLQLKWIEN